MTPLKVTARLRGAVVATRDGFALDALLAWRVAVDLELPPPRDERDIVPVEIPVQREAAGRFHLCSFGAMKLECAEGRFINRRAPLEQMQTLGNAKARRVDVSAGIDKSYRIPLPTMHVERDEVVWWCIGDREQIVDLLAGVAYLGKKRAVGLGRVERWEVGACEPWDAGFPVVRDGRPLRPLPPSWPGLVSPRLAHRTLTYPYWANSRVALCAVPI